MLHPQQISPCRLSFVEIEENENVVEKFKEWIESVRNILALDRVEQEACLKEKLAKIGQSTPSTEIAKVVSTLLNGRYCSSYPPFSLLQDSHLGNLRQRSKSTEHLPFPKRPSVKVSSEHLSRKNTDPSTAMKYRRNKPTEKRNVIANQTVHNNNATSLDFEDDQKTPSEATANDQPPCALGEYVVVETKNNGSQFGNVEFVGQTYFASGEWIGVALEQPKGEYLMGLVTSYVLLLPY